MLFNKEEELKARTGASGKEPRTESDPCSCSSTTFIPFSILTGDEPSLSAQTNSRVNAESAFITAVVQQKHHFCFVSLTDFTLFTEKH